MRSSGFIVVVQAYLLRKGISSVVGRLPGARVIREMESAEGLDRILRESPSAFLVISAANLEACQDLFMEDPLLQERTLVLNPPQADEAAGLTPATIPENAAKEEILAMIEKLVQTGRENPADKDQELTPREQTIVKLVSLGLTNKQIAEKLFLSAHTVITHRKNISSKLGIKSASGLTIYAIVNNLVTIEEASAKAGE